MTFRDIVEEASEAEEGRDAATPPRDDVAAAPDFTPLEDRVIALARRDGLGSIAPPGFLERLVGIAFGVRLGGRTLADPRLEMLRQSVVVARHRHHLPDAQALRLQGLGFTLRQIGLIERRAVAR